jgi:signal transduction histidine kinase/uncharacterized protein HemY
LFFFFFITSVSISQIDSLKIKEISKLPDKEKINKYLSVAYNLLNENNNAEEALIYSKKALVISEKINDYKSACNSLYLISQIYYYLEDDKNELKSYLKGLHYAKKINNKEQIFLFNSLLGKYYDDREEFQKAIMYYSNCLITIDKEHDKEQLAWLYNELGVTYFHLSKYEKALEYYFKALALKEDTEDKSGIARTLLNIGTIYSEMNNYKMALTYLQKSLKIAEYNKLIPLQATVLNNIGIIEQALDEYYKSINYLKRALKLSKQINDFNSIASINNNIGTAYEELGEYTTAKYFYENALDFYKNLNDLNGIAVTYRNLGNVNIKLGNIETAKSYLKNALTMADTNHLPAVRKNVFFSYAILYSNLGDHKKSDRYYNKYIRLRDSLNNAEYRNRIAKLQILYETEKKEKENKLLRLENEAKENALKQQNIIITFLVIVAFLIAGLAILLFVTYKNRQKYTQLVEEKNKLLEKSENILRETNAMKDKFFSIISHDLRNPFAALSMAVDNLKYNMDYMSSNKRQQVISSIEDSVNGTKELLTNLLEWARSQTQTIEYKPKKLDLAELIRNSLPLFKSNAEAKQISIHTSFERDCIVFADEDMLNTVIRNLVSNAIKFTPRGGDISIIVIKKGDFIETSVADTGVGIPSDIVDKIFRIDTKIKTQGTENEKGTGLGLILCNEFIEKNNGTISVSSELHKGSIFTFVLPSLN